MSSSSRLGSAGSSPHHLLHELRIELYVEELVSIWKLEYPLYRLYQYDVKLLIWSGWLSSDLHCHIRDKHIESLVAVWSRTPWPTRRCIFGLVVEEMLSSLFSVNIEDFKYILVSCFRKENCLFMVYLRFRWDGFLFRCHFVWVWEIFDKFQRKLE